ncbi:MAG: RHS repeat-associated core domain-containing protein [Fimbriimonadaceae bacterium]|nr:RHS repeat-associated core domain-containing protein [Fimbriimonadaceae bacterium]QYK58947.1 MAG: RHS repeat-associated core domain-containing protein [Fimbriimonadaceae bacterium]
MTRYALGARGGDMVETVLSMGLAGEQTVRSYPLYDGHGNMVAQVARAEDDAPGGSFVAVPGAPAFELGARRKYDTWGQVRSGSGPDQGYCANLGHRRDAESGLVYMRARYYEPWTGRFVSEDPARDGANWYVYCTNDPVGSFDTSGRNAIGWGLGAFLLFLVLWAPQSEGASTIRNGIKFLEAVIIGIVTGALNSQRVSQWTLEAADDLVRTFVASQGKSAKGMPQTALEICRLNVVIGFYVGYTFFLAFLMAELDQWVNGLVPE